MKWPIDGRADEPWEVVAAVVVFLVLTLVVFVLFRIEGAVEWNAGEMLMVGKGGGPPVLYAGSWNPPHRGHVALLRSMAAHHDRVYACVGHNSRKRYAVSAERRAQLVRAAVAADEKLRGKVEVIVESGYVWRAARRHGCTVLFRGIRTWKDDGAAELWLHVLNVLGPIFLGPFLRPVETRYIIAEPDMAKLSSSAVRDAVANGASLGKLVPAAIASDVRTLYAPKVKGG